MNRSPHALIVAIEEMVIEKLRAACERVGCAVTVVASVEASLTATARPEIAILAERLPDGHGVQLLRTLKREVPHLEALVLGDPPSLEGAVDALRAGAIDYLTAPLPPDALIDAKLRLALERREVALRLQRTIEDLRHSTDRIREAHLKVELAHLESLRALVETLEARDPYTRGHSERVARYSQALALELRVTTEEARRIRLGALLHDIGKIGIRDEILLKPARLSQDEYTTIQQHPVIGAAILSQLTSCEDLVPLVRYHHERIDGRGYPDGLAEVQIPRGARIISVADAYDAMTTTRPYRKSMTMDEALDELIVVAGRQVDREMVDAFCRLAKTGKLEHREAVPTDPFVVPIRGQTPEA